MKAYAKNFGVSPEVSVLIQVLLALGVTFLLLSCQGDDPEEISSIDPRESLAGEYQLKDYQVRFYDNVTIDTIHSINQSSRIEFIIEPDLPEDKLRIRLRGFLEVMFREIFQQQIALQGLSLSIDFTDQDDLVAKITSTSEFEVINIDFELVFFNAVASTVFPVDFQARGRFNNQKVEFQFRAQIPSGTLSVFEGTAEAVRPS